MFTLLELIQRNPFDRVAVVLPEQNLRVTYGELYAHAQALAEQLSAAGIGRGDRVAMALPNGLPMIVAFLAASEVGTAAPLNPAYKEDEFRFYLEDTNARVLILPPEGVDEARRAAGDREVLTVAVDRGDPQRVALHADTPHRGDPQRVALHADTPHRRDPQRVALHADTRRATLSGSPDRRPYAPPAPDDVALVLHTSGSTGRPKRVPLSHTNLSISAANVARCYVLGEDDVSMCVMPLFHVHGLVASTLATFASGGTVVVPAKFSPLAFWRIARDHGMTWYSAVPTIHQLLLARAADPTAASRRPPGAERLRFIRSCSAALPPRVMQALETAFGAPVVEAYGMTEAAHQMTSNPLPPAKRKPGSVGRGTDVRISIMNAQSQHCRPGDRGEVVIQGPNVIAGYENNPEANAASFVDGWFRTGDRGYLDDDGYLHLVARIKELINRGGEKISPREIDDVLLAHPAVAEAVSFGVPHGTWGEEVAAAVVVRQPVSEDDLIEYCRAHLAEYKRPKQIHITDAIPRTATGKVQRGVVARTYKQKAS